MTDDLILDEHRPAADGTRPLQVGQKLRSLTPELLEGEPRTCWSIRTAVERDLPAPSHCRGEIVGGDHYILWTEQDIDGRPTGRTEAYCAACAVAEWHEYGVSEISR